MNVDADTNSKWCIIYMWYLKGRFTQNTKKENHFKRCTTQYLTKNNQFKQKLFLLFSSYLQCLACLGHLVMSPDSAQVTLGLYKKVATRCWSNSAKICKYSDAKRQSDWVCSWQFLHSVPINSSQHSGGSVGGSEAPVPKLFSQKSRIFRSSKIYGTKFVLLDKYGQTLSSGVIYFFSFSCVTSARKLTSELAS